MWKHFHSGLFFLVLVVLESAMPIAGSTVNKNKAGGSSSSANITVSPLAKVYRPASPSTAKTTTTTSQLFPSIRNNGGGGGGDERTTLPRAAKQLATSHNVAASFVGNNNQRQQGQALVLEHQLPEKSARFFNVRRTVHCKFCSLVAYPSSIS